MFTINQNLIDDFADKINEKEKKNNKVTSLSSSSTHVQYPSAKAVYDAISEVEASSSGNYIYDFYHDSSTDDIVLEYDSASGGGSGGGSSVNIVTSWESTLSDEKVPSEKLVKNTIDGLSIPIKTSDLTNDGADGTNVYVANNDSRLSDSRTPTSHTHGSLTNDGKVGSNANYIVITGTGGAITSTQKLGNITYDGKIGSTSGKPLITTTSGTVTTGSFGSTSGTFAEGNHSHSSYVSATKVTSWSSTVSDSNVPSEKLVKDYIDNQIGTAIQYIQQ